MTIHAAYDLRVRLLVAREGDFDLYDYAQVESLSIRWGEDELGELELVLGGAKGRLVIKAAGVRTVRIPELVGRLYLPELEVEDWTERGLEGVRFHLVSQTNRDFRVLCNGLTVE